MEWWQALAVAALAPIVTAVGLIYQQRRTDQREDRRRDDERRDRAADRQHELEVRQLDLAETAEQARLDYLRRTEDVWRSERRELYAEFIELMRALTLTFSTWAMALDDLASEQPVAANPTLTSTSTVEADGFEELFAKVILLASDEAREAAESFDGGLLVVRLGAKYGHVQAGVVRKMHERMKESRTEFERIARIELGTNARANSVSGSLGEARRRREL